jgi:hypothetical protein
MSEIERKRRGDLELPPPAPVDWRSAKEAMRTRYNMEMRIDTAVRMGRRTLKGKRKILADIEDAPDQLDMMILRSVIYGAGELIQEYLNGRQ